MNNKGVTLIELLIVIVVIGIISAFAVPAVGQFLENAEKQAVYQDAIAVRNAAELYCSYDASCTTTQNLTYDNLSKYLDSFDESLYEYCATGNTNYIARKLATGGWQVRLEALGNGNANGHQWEWASNAVATPTTTTDPVDADSSFVTRD